MKNHPFALRLPAILVTVLCATIYSTAVTAEAQLGRLTCKRIAGTSVKLIITSSAQVRCIFEGSAGSEQWYVGKTGVKLGLDLKFGEDETLHFVVVSSTSNFVPEGDFLSGKYRGAKADAAFGLGVGAVVLLGGGGGTLALQPALETSSGTVGISAGIGFLDLEPDPLNQARIVTPHGSPFTQTLYAGYFNHGFRHYHMAPPDYASSDYFSNRAIATADSKPPAPETDTTWSLAGEQQRLAVAARTRLLKALRRDVDKEEDAANAQVNYDCWLHAMANGDADTQAHCRDGFERHVDIVETAAAEQDFAAVVSQPMWLRVLFDTDVSTLDGNEDYAFTAIKKRLQYLSKVKIHVTGHADKPGTPEYNQKLSEKRAEAVHGALVQSGIPASSVTSDAFGVERPLNNNPHDALNRRVDIVIEPLAVDEAAVKAEVARRKTR
jgi:OmpA-OmpF porin, OOP family